MELHDHAEDYAEKLTDNWKSFDSFGLHDPEHDYEGAAIWHTLTRDSELITKANAQTIEEGMQPFLDGKQAWSFSARHWAVGWVDGYAVRVRDAEGEFTPAFLYMVETLLALHNYPVLDTSLLSDMENEAMLENIRYDMEEFERLLPDEALSAEVKRDPMAIARFFDDHYATFERETERGAPSRAGVLSAMIALKMVVPPRCPHCTTGAVGTIYYKKEKVIACTCGVTFSMYGGHETFSFASLFEKDEDT